MKNFFILLSFLFSTQTFGQGNGWEWQNPLPQGNQFHDIKFIDGQIGWAITYEGTVLRTTNSGFNWVVKYNESNYSINHYQFLDAQTGWVLFKNNEVIRTTDGGETWTKSTIGTSNLYNTSLHFSSPQHGWMVGTGGKLLQSLDGGLTWNINNLGSNCSLRSVFSLNSQMAWIAGDSGNVFKTTNAGNSWINYKIPLFNGNLKSVQFTDSLNGFVGSGSIIFKTTNGGATWIEITSGFSSNISIVNFFFLDNQVGWCGTYNGTCKIYKTTNGGVNWTVFLEIPGVNSEFSYRPCVLDSLQAWIVDSNMKLTRTTNGGNTWEVIDPGNRPYLVSVYFLSPQKGWAVGFPKPYSDRKGKIMKTENGGGLWTTQSTNWPRFVDIRFVNEQTGFIVGDSGLILKTSDSGVTWIKNVSGTEVLLRTIRFVNPQTGWIAGDGGVILKTTDGGENWISQSSGTTVELRYISFFDSQNGWIGGLNQGVHLFTTNGGNTWQPFVIGSNIYISDICFTGPQNGIGVGPDGFIYKTTNGGLNWVLIRFNMGYDLWKIQFITDQIGFVSGAEVLSTTDGGQTWNNIRPPISDWYCTSFFYDAQNGWAVGENGSILHTTTGGLTPIHKTIVSAPSFSLYPNPAEETVSIEAKGEIVSLRITDALGREISSPSDGVNTGLEAREINIRHLKPGIYWLNVQTAEGVSVQRLIKK